LLRGSFSEADTEEGQTRLKDPTYVERPRLRRWRWSPSLLLVGANDGVPHVIALRVPCWNRSAAGCTGQFSLDLRAVDMAPRKAQPYFVYGSPATT
jgi:hypothetical protein